MAHIFAANDKGPRANPSMSDVERGSYDNLVLLCPSCHTKVDKAPRTHPDHLILEWKRKHKERIAATFGAVQYPEPQFVRTAIEPLLAENKTIFDTYGPMQDYRFDPESEMAQVWRRKVLSLVLPNNRKLLAILDSNRRHLTGNEQLVLEKFRQHVDDMESRHLEGRVASVGTRFPDAMNALLGDVANGSTRE